MLEEEIEKAWEEENADKSLLEDFLRSLDKGDIRAAEKTDSEWKTNSWVKKGILLCFSQRNSRNFVYGGIDYYDKFDLRDTDDIHEKGTRNVPGSFIREGCYIGSSCILMPPTFINVGSYIDDETLVDSCVVVGSCAQIGEKVKIGANTLIGGVLEPVENSPVIIEDGASLGAGCRVTSGFIIGKDSVVAENTLLNPSIPIYDLVEEEIIYGKIPKERRVVQRYVESSIDIGEKIYKPAAVATSLEQETIEKTQKEEKLRT